MGSIIVLEKDANNGEVVERNDEIEEKICLLRMRRRLMMSRGGWKSCC